MENLALSGKCLVCGEQLVGAITSCSACATPSHKGCAEYLGGCAVYACTEVAKPVQEALQGVTPQDQQRAYQSFLGRLWDVANKPISQVSISDLFGAEEEPVVIDPSFGVEEYDDFSRIHGVNYRGLLSTYDIQNDYFAGGQRFTSDQLIKTSQEEHKKGGFVGASLEER